MTPLNPIVEALVCRLDTDLREAFEERAGIMQFEAGQPRELAEALALLDVIRMNPLAVAEVTAWRVELDGQVLTVLTADPHAARQHLSAIGATKPQPVDLTEAVRHLSEVAVLARMG